jgi:hypothetical protein
MPNQANDSENQPLQAQRYVGLNVGRAKKKNLKTKYIQILRG